MGLDNLFIIQKKFSPYEKQIIHNKLEMDLIIEEESSNYVCSTCQEPLKNKTKEESMNTLKNIFMCQDGDHMTCQDCVEYTTMCPDNMEYEWNCLQVKNILEEEDNRRMKASNDIEELEKKVCELNNEMLAKLEHKNKRKRGRPKLSESNKRAKLEEKMDDEEEKGETEKVKRKVGRPKKVKRKVGRPKGSKNKQK